MTARSPKPVLFVAACALLDADGRILIAKRPEGKAMAGFWEFPGGKIEPGETPEQAVVRELREELSVEPCERCLHPFAFVSHPYDDFHIVMPLFLCRTWDGFPHPNEGQELAWVRKERLRDYQMSGADVSLAAELRDRL
ncbi:MAG: 8-oxo-dGTP diphosphatase [Maricaulis maris]|jgi:8-oxo-dGTP diphosphatase|uniref:8-oxo-dGTP diphosphatase n=1 Tax=Maricaulis maris (strain MCS10) TaxID=394221 RepID=Q0AMD5_MARMM|nr:MULTISPECIES: 8-oxo-dGTP diphosphatase MutT [Maricaulis]ABI66558.1 8-oxo-dGTPase [Maricaulis maris MCS10]MAC88063.1 8-oxo-dGTP diphosphatase MutT [Maricaulis sp.]